MQATHEPMRVINHKRMRRIVGYTALLLPPVVVWLSGREGLSSISISYWTDSQDIFVGSLFAVGFFLAAYNGTGTCGRLEKSLSRLACAFAILVALFPTIGFDQQTDFPPSWVLVVSNLVGLKSQLVHGIAALLLFVCLFFMLLVFSFRASRKGKAHRSMAYLAFSLGMLIGLPVLYLILEYVIERSDTIFFVEWVGLWLFGFGWFLAGAYRRENKDVPEGAKKLTPNPIAVDPRDPNVPTRIQIKDGAQYFFLAEGCWKDWLFHCGPDGWGPKWNPLARKNRIKGQPFFALCGNVGKSKDETFNFCIGGMNSWSVPNDIEDVEDRELYLFANDWPDAYENNKKLEPDQGGPLTVTIYELTVDDAS
jgi:hypothetical protein